MAVRLNSSASFLIKKGFFVLYYNYNFYFFKKETKRWLEMIIAGKKRNVPKDFIEYLKEKDLLV